MSLLPVGYKNLSNILLNMITPYVNEIIRERHKNNRYFNKYI